MLLQTRPIAFTAAVIAFFVLSIVGCVVSLSPATCCKRAVLGAVVTYLVASVAMRAVDAIVTAAMIASQISKDQTGDRKN
jgi:ABC-type transporter Mla maintaining outer membrane lipid asymmetry permease subunit MlaE